MPEPKNTTPKDTDPLTQAKKIWVGYPEAPFRDSFKWVDEAGFEHLTTCSGWTPAHLAYNIAELKADILDAQGQPVNSRPKAAPPAADTVPFTDETGAPVVDGNTGQQETIKLPAGVHLYTTAALFHDKTQDGLDALKVTTIEPPYNTKYGVRVFEGGPVGWTGWPIGVENKYMPPDGFGHCLIEDPKEGKKFAKFLEFRP